MKPKIIAQNNGHLRQLIQKEIKLNGYQCDLNHIDVSYVKDMSYLFYDLKFNGNISNWDVSNVENMNAMFIDSSTFKKDLSNWKPYKLISLDGIFEECEAPVPYWAKIEDQKARNEAINKYQETKNLSEELDKELNNNNNSPNKKFKL